MRDHERVRPPNPELSGIDGQDDLFVQAAIRKAVLGVDEDGAEAAAATRVGVGLVAAIERFVADPPFVLAIYDHLTGSILFLGRLEDPSTASAE